MAIEGLEEIRSRHISRILGGVASEMMMRKVAG